MAIKPRHLRKLPFLCVVFSRFSRHVWARPQFSKARPSLFKARPLTCLASILHTSHSKKHAQATASQPAQKACLLVHVSQPPLVLRRNAKKPAVDGRHWALLMVFMVMPEKKKQKTPSQPRTPRGSARGPSEAEGGASAAPRAVLPAAGACRGGRRPPAASAGPGRGSAPARPHRRPSGKGGRGWLRSTHPKGPKKKRG